MGVNVFAAVFTGVALEQVLDAIDQTPQPVAINHRIQGLAIQQKQTQQTSQVVGSPATITIGFGKTNVTRLQHRGKHPPVGQVHPHLELAGWGAKFSPRTIRQLQLEATRLQTRQQLQHALG